jgi:hypothetical protein
LSAKVKIVKRGNPASTARGGRPTVRQAVGGLVWDAETSEGSAVIAGIPGATFPAP